MQYQEFKLYVFRMKHKSETENYPFQTYKRNAEYLYYPDTRVDVHYSDINTEDKVKEFCRNVLYDGLFVIRKMVRSYKNKTGFKFKRLFLVKINGRNVHIKQNFAKRLNWWDHG